MAIATLLRDGKHRALRVLRDQANRRSVPQRSWFVIWNITTACNLTCKYCKVPTVVQSRPVKGEATKHLHLLLELDPRSLVLFGAEPTMAADLPDAVRVLKENRPELWIQLNSNGVLEPILTEVIPMINKLELSLDAIGDSCKFLTGASAKPLLGKFKRYHALAQQHGVPISIHAVITQANYRDLPELVAWMRDNLPGVWLSIRPIIPDSHPLSVQNDPEVNADFMRVVESLPEEVGRSFISDPTRQSKMSCSRQFFRTVVDFDGSLRSCKVEQSAVYLEGQHYRNRPRLQGAWDAARDFGTAYHSLVARPTSMTCIHSCEWFLPFDHFLSGKVSADYEGLDFLHGTLDLEDVKELNDYTGERLGKTFSLDELGPFLKPGVRNDVRIANSNRMAVEEARAECFGSSG
ncbi:MAG: radical SAM protein [Candidatus Omnitrophica bacterium]|nr:radical SAM protein [Candidatus Omnitrophota bacterium]